MLLLKYLNFYIGRIIRSSKLQSKDNGKFIAAILIYKVFR